MINESHTVKGRASLVAQTVKNLPAMQETWVRSLAQEDLLEKGRATHSSILAWRIPWTEEPGRLKSMGYKESHMTEQLPLSHLHLMQLIIKLYLHLPFCYIYLSLLYLCFSITITLPFSVLSTYTLESHIYFLIFFLNNIFELFS